FYCPSVPRSLAPCRRSQPKANKGRTGEPKSNRRQDRSSLAICVSRRPMSQETTPEHRGFIKIQPRNTQGDKHHEAKARHHCDDRSSEDVRYLCENSALHYAASRFFARRLAICSTAS